MMSTPASASGRTASSVTPPDTSTTAAAADDADGGAYSREIHVVEHDHLGAGGQRRAHLVDRLGLDLERVRSWQRGAHALDRRGDAAGGPDVIVLDHHPIEEAEPVRHAAAVHHGRLLEDAQARRSLARRRDARLRAGSLGDIARRQRGDPRESRQKVQSRTLHGEDRRQRTAHVGDRFAGGEHVAVGARERDRQPLVDELCRGLEGGAAGEHAGDACHHVAAAVAGERPAGEVAVFCEILGERPSCRFARSGGDVRSADHDSRRRASGMRSVICRCH